MKNGFRQMDARIGESFINLSNRLLMPRTKLNIRRWSGLLIALMLSLPCMLSAQSSKQIKGVVTNESTREALSGVTVTVKGTSVATLTNEKGEYSIAAAGSDVLVFSTVGYQPSEVPVTKETMNIKMSKDVKSLDDVVVIGYGSQSKRNVTGSISTVDVKRMEEVPVTNISQALRGKVAGVQFNDDGRPGQSGSILIRGQRSISASNDPLIVLDGIIFEGSLSDINPGDIQSMDVLKDASSTAIYGSRAANGVILVTSKAGKSVEPTIRFSSYYGVSDWSHKPKLLSPQRYVERLLDFREQSNLAADPADVADYLTPTEAKNYLAGKTIDPWDVVSQHSTIQNYDLSVSGRSGKTNYFFSGNYSNDKGLIFNDQAKRLGVRVNLTNQVKDWLKIGMNAQFTNRDMSGTESDVLAAFRTSPFASPWLDDARTDPNPMPTEDILIGSINFNAITNRNQEIQRNLFANFFAVVDFPFLQGLSFRINYSPNYRWYSLNNFDPVYQRNGLNNKGFASREFASDQAYVLENILTYNKRIGKDHDFDITLLYGRNGSRSDSLLASGTDFTGTSDADGWDNLALAKIQASASSASVINAISSMARINYRFKNRYLVTLTARRDGSSVFGANHKFGTFPSAALAWIASQESFLKSVSAIKLLKLRLSYGSVGNQAILPYQSLTRLGAVQYVYGDGGSTSVGLYPANLANPNLSWETTTTANLGVDFDLFNGRIGGTVEIYNMDTKDLLLTRQLPSTTGFSNILTNVGATNNKGLEVTLNTINLRKGKFEWSSNLVFSTNRNKIVHLYNSDANGDGKEDNDISNSWFIGKPISVAYDYKVAGVYQTADQIPVGQQPGFFRMADINGDGKIDATDREVLGTLQPKYHFGFTNNFTYGNFNFLITLSAMTGWIANNLRLTLDDATHGPGTYPGRENFLDAGWWTADNKSQTRSSLVYTNPFNHGYYQSRDFLRIQEVALSYEFPKRIIDRLKVNDLKVYVSGRNLFTFTKWQGMDPESGTSLFPFARTVSAGLNLSF
jgi:TonB-linked SusC/RagA family outer membrane protein